VWGGKKGGGELCSFGGTKGIILHSGFLLWYLPPSRTKKIFTSYGGVLLLHHEKDGDISSVSYCGLSTFLKIKAENGT